MRGGPVAAGFHAALLFVAAACGDRPSEPPGEEPSDPRIRFDLQALGPTPYPAGNPPSAAKVALGQLLFFDPILSGERDVACATCHHPDFGFADGRPRSIGPGGSGLGPGRTAGVSAVSGMPVDEMSRNAPTVLNAAMNGRGTAVPDALGLQFWDGRAEGLEEQALLPIAARDEMRGDAYPAEHALDSVVARLGAIPEYVELFAAAFPGRTLEAEGIAQAIATYQRELVTRDARFDRYVAGEDDALTAPELRGLEIFFDRGACTQCHAGPLLGAFGFHVTGVPNEGPGGGVIAGDDTGREEHTGDPADRRAFKAVSLRNVALTAPYMHDGVFATLEDVVGFYSDNAHPRHTAVSDDLLSPLMPRDLALSPAEAADLVAFLGTLSDPGRLVDPGLRTVPAQVPSGLTPGGE